jgi:hypothetical protein
MLVNITEVSNRIQNDLWGTSSKETVGQALKVGDVLREERSN